MNSSNGEIQKKMKGWKETGAESQQTERNHKNAAAHSCPDMEPRPRSEMCEHLPYHTPNSCFLFNQVLNSRKLKSPPRQDLDKLGLFGNLFRSCGVNQACANGY